MCYNPEMQFGLVFPTTEIGADPGAIRAFVAALPELGFRHLLFYEHVVGADPASHPGWSGAYDIEAMFHEPMVTMGFLAGVTDLELATAVLILPERQATLVAKQAAEVDVLCNGRLRLGIGLGWNEVEYAAMGASFRDRGRRVEEQIEVMRRLWTERVVHFRGEAHHLDGVGISPMPVQQPIPVWIGARSAPAYRRVGRVADGWFPPGADDLSKVGGPSIEDAIAMVHEAARDAGRDPARIGMEARITADGRDLERTAEKVELWRALGATHLAVNTMRADLGGVDGHLRALAAIAEVLV